MRSRRLMCGALAALLALGPAAPAVADLESDYYYCTSSAFERDLQQLQRQYERQIARGQLYEAAATRMEREALIEFCREVIRDYRTQPDDDQPTKPAATPGATPDTTAPPPAPVTTPSTTPPGSDQTSGPRLYLNADPVILRAKARPQIVALGRSGAPVRVLIDFDDREQPATGWVLLSNGSKTLRAGLTFVERPRFSRATAALSIPGSPGFLGNWDVARMLLTDARGDNAAYRGNDMSSLHFSVAWQPGTPNEQAEPDTDPAASLTRPTDSGAWPATVAAVAIGLLLGTGLGLLAWWALRRRREVPNRPAP